MRLTPSGLPLIDCLPAISTSTQSTPRAALQTRIISPPMTVKPEKGVGAPRPGVAVLGPVPR